MAVRERQQRYLQAAHRNIHQTFDEEMLQPLSTQQEPEAAEPRMSTTEPRASSAADARSSWRQSYWTDTTRAEDMDELTDGDGSNNAQTEDLLQDGDGAASDIDQ